MLTVLRQRNFALLWTGGFISALGDTVLLVALPFYIYQRTGSALATGTMFIVETVPRIMLGSVAGVFVDRWDRRKTMVVCDLSRAALLLMLLPVVSLPGLLWIVYLVAFAQSAITQFFGPANGALLPRVVGKEHLLAANSLGAINQNVNRLVGPALGGALLGLFGLTSVLLADAASFSFSAVMIALVRAPASTVSTSAGTTTDPPATTVAMTRWTTFWHDWLAGLRLVRTDHVLTTIFIVGGTLMVAQGLLNALFPAWVTAVLHLGALEFGWITAAQGVGGVLGGLLIGHVSKVAPPIRLIAPSGVLLGILFLIMFNTRSLPFILTLSAVNGLPVTGFVVSLHTLLQTSVADQFRGRLLGAYITTGSLLMLIGLGLGTMLGDRLSIPLLLNGVGGLLVLAGLEAAVLLSRSQARRGAAPPPRPPAATPGIG